MKTNASLIYALVCMLATCFGQEQTIAQQEPKFPVLLLGTRESYVWVGSKIYFDGGLTRDTSIGYQVKLYEHREKLRSLESDMKYGQDTLSGLQNFPDRLEPKIPIPKKDEFETTQQYQIRLAAATAEADPSFAKKIAEAVAKIEIRKSELAKLHADGTPESATTQGSKLSQVEWFCIPVSMLEYDADRELATFCVLGDEWSDHNHIEHEIDMRGDLAGAKIPVGAARLLREDPGYYYVVFQAPLAETPRFESSNKVENVPIYRYEPSLAEKNSSIAGALAGMATYAIGNALGLKSGVNSEVATTTSEEIRKELQIPRGESKLEKIEKVGERHEKLSFGWLGKPTPLALLKLKMSDEKIGKFHADYKKWKFSFIWHEQNISERVVQHIENYYEIRDVSRGF